MTRTAAYKKQIAKAKVSSEAEKKVGCELTLLLNKIIL